MSIRSFPLVIALALSALFVRGSHAADVKKESPVDLALTSMDGKKVRLHDYLGKVVVLNFWATWCGPCREEMPLMVEAEKAWDAKGVVFIGASLDDNSTKKNIPAFIRQYSIGFPIWTGASLDHLEKLHLGNAVPDTAFLDPDGIVFARVRGEIRKPELEERLQWVTGNRTTPPPQSLVVHLDK